MPADREQPEPGADRDAAVDAAFAAIVAGWDQDCTDPVPRWPASEDRPDDAGAHPPPATSMEQIRFVRDHGLPTPSAPADPQPDEPQPGSLAGPRDWELAARTDEHFVPPEPPPLPRGDLVSRSAWAGVALGPLFLLLCAVVWRDVDRLWLYAAAAAFVAGFVVLVMRLPDAREHDGDDGAVL